MSSVESRGVGEASFITVFFASKGQFLMMLVKEGKEYCNKSFRLLYKGEVGIRRDDIFDGVWRAKRLSLVIECFLMATGNRGRCLGWRRWEDSRC
jgi:hypothetical protein